MAQHKLIPPPVVKYKDQDHSCENKTTILLPKKRVSLDRESTVEYPCRLICSQDRFKMGHEFKIKHKVASITFIKEKKTPKKTGANNSLTGI